MYAATARVCMEPAEKIPTGTNHLISIGFNNAHHYSVTARQRLSCRFITLFGMISFLTL